MEFKASLEEAQAAPPSPGRTSALLMQHGSMSLRFYAPQGHDGQKPHDQDELYVVASGSGAFVMNGQRVSFVTGDTLFAPAGSVHRFEDFTDDFATWVIFYGPDGGEVP